MITYKITSNTDILLPINRQFMSAARSSYVYWQKNPDTKQSDVEKYIKTLGYYDLLDSSMIKMAVNSTKNLRKKENVIFGSISLFNKIKNGKATELDKNLWKRSRQTGMELRGSTSDQNGNRKARLDISNNQVIVWSDARDKHTLTLSMSKTQKRNLLIVQNLCEQRLGYFTIQINNGYVCIKFPKELLAEANNRKIISGRVMGIDLNPNYVAVVISDNGKVIHKRIYDHLDINKKDVKTTKKKFEKIETVIDIVKLAVHFQCEAISIEKLKMDAKNHGKGKTFNRLVNNTWHKNLTINSIKKWGAIKNVKVIEVYAAYTSFVGAILNPEDYDSIAAAIEIAERGIKVVKSLEYKVLPETYNFETLPNLWKDALMSRAIEHSIVGWKKLFDWAKASSFSYRLLFKRDEKLLNFSSHRLKSYRSKVLVHVINIDQNVSL